MAKARNILNNNQFMVLPVWGFSTSPSPNEELSSSSLSGTISQQPTIEIPTTTTESIFSVFGGQATYNIFGGIIKAPNKLCIDEEQEKLKPRFLPYTCENCGYHTDIPVELLDIVSKANSLNYQSKDVSPSFTCPVCNSKLIHKE